MRTKFVAATIVAGVLFIASCKWFSPAPKPEAFSMVGKWTIDSIEPGKDSSKAIFLALFSLRDDTSSLAFDFHGDSTFTQLPAQANNNGKYYLKERQLFIAEDSSFVPYQLNVLSDSLINLYSTDSTLFVLKRQ